MISESLKQVGGSAILPPPTRSIRSGNSDDMKAAQKAGLRDGMAKTQMQMAQTTDVNERLRLAEQYNDLAKRLQQ